jgi:hypothetical protein
VEGDLLSMDDDEIRYSPGLAAHPALDPYEGMPWSSTSVQNGQDRDVRPRIMLIVVLMSSRLDRTDISMLGFIV